MSGKYGANQYKKTSIQTASRGQILILLYEAAIKNLKKAAQSIEQNDLSAKGQAIGKTHDIINELAVTLDFEAGGQIAQDLERLYHYMSGELIQANAQNSPEKLRNIQKLLETLLEGWRQAVAQTQNISSSTSSTAQSEKTGGN